MIVLKMRLLFIIIFIFDEQIYAQSIGFIKGVDISILYQVEQNGGVFYENGIEKDPIEIFKDHGVNAVRLKLWHTPILDYNGLPRVLQMAQRIDTLGLDLMLDIHYSDTWADPGNQTKPSAWEALDFETLSDSVFHYTKNVVTKFKAQGTLPKFIQIGNETDCGFLWPDGYVCDESNTDTQWQNLGILFNHAISGIQEAIDETNTVWTIGHLSSGGIWFFSNLFDENASIDIIGQSYYPWWHGSLDDLSNNLAQLGNEFQKPIIVVETAYPFTSSWNDNTNNIVGMDSQLLDGFPASELGQYNFLQNVKTIIEDNEYGAGICYWSPEWISTESYGSPWENLALFDFSGEVLQGITVFESENAEIDENIIPESTSLQLFPNPFNPTTNIRYENPIFGFVEIMIYNINGELVETLVNRDQRQGEQSILWNADKFSSCVYFYQLKLDGEIFRTKRAVLLK